MRNFDNKLVYITGGSSGIGLAAAKEFLGLGASLLLIARNEEKLNDAAAELKQLSTAGRENRVFICSLDISNNSEVHSVLSEQIKSIGVPDVLVNCAGMSYPEYFENIPYEIYQKTIATNLTGPWNVLTAVIPSMKRGSHILNVSSIAGFLGVFGFTAYSASKFGLIGLSEALRGELKPRGIGVSVLCPPDTDTPGMIEENLTKPEETHAISGNVKLMSAESVAKIMVKGIKRNKFLIIPGFLGKITFILKMLFPSLIFQIMDNDVGKIQKNREKLKI